MSEHEKNGVERTDPLLARNKTPEEYGALVANAIRDATEATPGRRRVLVAMFGWGTKLQIGLPDNGPAIRTVGDGATTAEVNFALALTVRGLVRAKALSRGDVRFLINELLAIERAMGR